MHPPYGAGPASKKKKLCYLCFRYTKMPANLANALATR